MAREGAAGSRLPRPEAKQRPSAEQCGSQEQRCRPNPGKEGHLPRWESVRELEITGAKTAERGPASTCLLYTSDAADDM
eukprot:15054023-Alexandrium_andersonii.AAC.1